MPLNSGRPIIGRLASAGFGFLSSTAGLPVAGSIGAFSQTMTPQMSAPHLLTRTLASPACVSQIPLASPPACARAGETKHIAHAATTRPKPQAINLKAENRGVMNGDRYFGNAGNVPEPDMLSNKAGGCKRFDTGRSPGQAAEIDDSGLRRAAP